MTIRVPLKYYLCHKFKQIIAALSYNGGKNDVELAGCDPLCNNVFCFIYVLLLLGMGANGSLVFHKIHPETYSRDIEKDQSQIKGNRCLYPRKEAI